MPSIIQQVYGICDKQEKEDAHQAAIEALEFLLPELKSGKMIAHRIRLDSGYMEEIRIQVSRVENKPLMTTEE